MNLIVLMLPNESLPEDICFFRKDKSLFFGSVSHESIARFYVTEVELESCQIPKTFEELPYETISTYSGNKMLHLAIREFIGAENFKK